MKPFTPCPKPAKPERGNARCKAYMAAVAQLPCCICGVLGVHVHHCRTGRFAQTKPSDLDTIALCEKHHRFRHEHPDTFQTLYGFDIEYIAATRKAVEKLTGLKV